MGGGGGGGRQNGCREAVSRGACSARNAHCPPRPGDQSQSPHIIQTHNKHTVCVRVRAARGGGRGGLQRAAVGKWEPQVHPQRTRFCPTDNHPNHQERARGERHYSHTHTTPVRHVPSTLNTRPPGKGGGAGASSGNSGPWEGGGEGVGGGTTARGGEKVGRGRRALLLHKSPCPVFSVDTAFELANLIMASTSRVPGDGAVLHAPGGMEPVEEQLYGGMPLYKKARGGSGGGGDSLLSPATVLKAEGVAAALGAAPTPGTVTLYAVRLAAVARTPLCGCSLRMMWCKASASARGGRRGVCVMCGGVGGGGEGGRGGLQTFRRGAPHPAIVGTWTPARVVCAHPLYAAQKYSSYSARVSVVLPGPPGTPAAPAP